MKDRRRRFDALQRKEIGTRNYNTTPHGPRKPVLGAWRENGAGNYSRLFQSLHLTVFKRDGGWAFMRAQALNGNPGRTRGQLPYRQGKKYWDDRVFATVEEAMKAAETFG